MLLIPVVSYVTMSVCVCVLRFGHGTTSVVSRRYGSLANELISLLEIFKSPAGSQCVVILVNDLSVINIKAQFADFKSAHRLTKLNRRAVI